MNSTKRIAVIGSGISGLVSASLLSQRYDVTLFEANDYLGGHTRTVDVVLKDQQYAVDTGFVVFNQLNYPNFSKLIHRYKIPINPSEMSFSFRSDIHNIEYNGHNLNTLFADRRNLFKPRFYRFIKDILRFNKDAQNFLKKNEMDVTLEEFVQSKQYSSLFLDAYLVPIIAAIWTKKIKDVWNYPAYFLLKFFSEHGLLNISNRPAWHTISGGSRNYIPKLINNFKDKIHLNTKVEQLQRRPDTVILKTKDDQIEFDAVVVAVHSDQALKMLAEPTEDEKLILSAIRYRDNKVILHTDSSLLPKKRLAWASWNYYNIGSEQPTLTYYMNRLHGFSAPEDVCLSVNLDEKICQDKIIQSFSYAHPIFNDQALKAQKKYENINGSNYIYYCGAYWGYGFHEDGVNSALVVCRLLGVEL
jgi:predicted NAD/FAD-binding protein